MIKNVLFLVIFTVISTVTIASDYIKIPFGSDFLRLDVDYVFASYMDYHVDEEGTLTISDVVGQEFQRVKGNINFGFTNKTYWVKFKLKSNQESSVLVEFGYPNIDVIEVYHADNDEEIHVASSGRQISYNSKKYKNRNYLFDLHVHEGINVFYIKFSGLSGIQAPIHIWKDFDTFQQYDRANERFYNFWYGAAVAIILYNLFIFLSVSVNKKAYGFYVLYLISFLFYQMTFDGFLSIYFLPNTTGYWIHYWFNISTLICVITGYLFLNYFLELSTEHKLINKVGLAILYSSIVSLPLVFFFDYVAALTTLLAMVIVIYSVFLGVWIVLNDDDKSNFFILGWFSLFVGLVISALKQSGMIPGSFWIDKVAHFGSLLEFLFLSFALTDTMNIMRDKLARSRLKLLKLKDQQIESARRLEKISLEQDTASMVKNYLVARVHNFSNDYIDFSGHCQSASKVSGNWYQYRFQRHEDTFEMFLGQVSGFGLPAALMTAVTAGLYSSEKYGPYRLIGDDPVLGQFKHPSYRLNVLNEVFYDMSHGDYTMKFQGVLINVRQGLLISCSAGAPPLLVMRKIDNQVKVFDVLQKTPVIGASRTSKFDVELFDLKPGDLIVSYSSGIYTNVNNRGQEWSRTDFIHSITTVFKDDVNQIRDTVVADLQKHIGAMDIKEDITVVFCRYKGSTEYS